MKPFYVLIPALIFILFPSCQRADHPGFGEEDLAVQVPFVDFDTRVSGTFTGLVRFTNKSKGMVRQEWDFGFYDSSGKPAGSTVTHPLITFPANGRYLVTLHGVDQDSAWHHISRSVEINNY